MDHTPPPSDRILTQNPRAFTVQVRHAQSDAILGAGVVISDGGQIITCAHVVTAAGVDPRRPEGAEVGVYFPQALDGAQKARRAVVAGSLPGWDDDLTLLQLVGGPPPLGPEQIARLGAAGPSQGNRFRAYGYAPRGPVPSGWADGVIEGYVERPPDLHLHAEPVELHSPHIAAGMSGAGVLDTVRNLVVGLVSEAYYPPDGEIKLQDVGYAVDAGLVGQLKLVDLAPLAAVQPAAQPLAPAPAPKADPAAVQAAQQLAAAAQASGRGRFVFVNAPPALPEWTGRAELLAALTADWLDPAKHVAGLIGFGGEGKSSLARRWVEELLHSAQPPEGLFWWGFYENRSVDEFLEAALAYLSGGRIDPRAIPSAGLRAQLVGAMLSQTRTLFVLDGLEVLQHPEGDQYGLLQSNELRDVLSYFARPDNAAFCLVTSRAPLVDLLDYTSYAHHDLARLLPADGRALLRKLGVQGTDAALDALVLAWDGHALTLSLLAALLVERHQGRASHAADLPAPVAGEPRYERVARVLARYDAHLSDPERRFLELFAAFRTPVPDETFRKVFQPLLKQPTAALRALAQRLAAYRLLRHDAATQTYTAHPLVRNYYLAQLSRGAPAQAQAAHAQIKVYYLSIAGETPHYPTLDDLQPLIEVVHHACQAGAYDEACDILWNRIYQTGQRVLVNQLGAWDTALELLQEFFPDGDAAQAPQVNDRRAQRWILNEAGLCLQSLGRLAEAAPFYERAAAIDRELQDDLSGASGTLQNLADLHLDLGDLPAAQAAAAQALDLARRAADKENEKDSLAYQAWTAHLQGAVPAAADLFAQAKALQRELEPGKRYLYSLGGLWHAAHLRRAGRPAEARQVAEANLAFCEEYHAPHQASQCHSQLGALDAAEGQAAAAAGHFAEALRLARSISDRATLIEALRARGLWAARYPAQTGPPAPLAQAQAELSEALGYALAGGYRIYEADIRIALAWAALAAGDPAAARREAGRARELSQEMGYHWGLVDADEVLAAILEFGLLAGVVEK
jgi:tetratricopeptide (TPR) repeat protein